MLAYVPIRYTLLIWQGVPICQPSADPDPLPQLSALILQLYATPLQPITVRAPPAPPIHFSQGLGVPPYSTFSRMRLCSSDMLMESNVCVESEILYLSVNYR